MEDVTSPTSDDDGASEREGEEALEPVSLIEQSGAILRTGKLMLASGTATYRVKQAMRAVSKSLGIDRHTQQVSLTDIAATSHRGRIFRTEVAENRTFVVNTDRLMRLDRFRRTLPERTTAAEIHRALDEIESRTPLYPAAAHAAFGGVACAAFAVLNSARIGEVAVVFVAAFLAALTRRDLGHRGVNPFGATIVAAAVASFTYLGGIALINATGSTLETHAAGYISSVLFLLPGFLLVTGALDMAKLDLLAGLERIAFGAMITMAAGVSVWGVSLIGTLETAPRAEDVSLGVHIILWAVASGLGVMGFAFMFNSPWRLALNAGVIGIVANTGRLIAIDAGVRIQAATAIACFAVGVLAAIAARGGRFPVITLSVPAVLVMIPGVAAHEALVSLNTGDYFAAVAGGLLVVLIVLSIMVGLVTAKLVTDREWTVERH